MCNFVRKESLTQVFFCEFHDIFLKTFFIEHRSGCFCISPNTLNKNDK